MIELGYSKRDIVVPLCENSTEVLVRSAMEGCMGRVWVYQLENPSFCIIKLGNYVYPIGLTPTGGERLLQLRALIINECNRAYITPQNEAWESWLKENLDCNYRMVSRYALKKDEQHFDKKVLKSYVESLSKDMKIKHIDKYAYKVALAEDWSSDFVSNFESESKFLEHGMGYVIYHNRQLVSGCSAYGVSEGMMEVTVATRKDYRRKGLAVACAAKFILDCMDKHIYPNWDAANFHSVELAQKLGYVFDKEYEVFQIDI